VCCTDPATCTRSSASAAKQYVAQQNAPLNNEGDSASEDDDIVDLGWISPANSVRKLQKVQPPESSQAEAESDVASVRSSFVPHLSGMNSFRWCRIRTGSFENWLHG
jgi:hypothetical protein